MAVTSTSDWYQAYLDSEHWKQLRTRLIAQRHEQCEVCKSTISLNVHHKKYKLGKEHDAHLAVLCRFCHNQFHQRFAMRLSLSKGVFRCVRRGLAMGVPLDRAWARASQNFQHNVEHIDKIQANKRKTKTKRSLQRQQDTRWRSNYDIPMSYYLARDE